MPDDPKAAPFRGPVTPPSVSPVVQEFTDFEGRAISISVAFNTTTRAITGMSSHRDAGCLFSKILIGTSADGNPDDTDKVVAVPFGDRTLNSTQLAALATHGLATIEDFSALQITAGL